MTAPATSHQLPLTNRSHAFLYCIETAKLALLIALPIGLVLGCVRGRNYITERFFLPFLEILRQTVNSTVWMTVLLLFVCVLLVVAVTRLTNRPRLAAFAGVGVVCGPFLLFGAYGLNRAFLPGFLELESIIGNGIAAAASVALWTIVSLFLSRWISSVPTRWSRGGARTLLSLAAVLAAFNGAVFLVGVLRANEGPNVIVILIDTLRADHVGTYGYARDTTPNIDAFAKESVVFRQAVSQSTFTKTATASLFTGRYPHRHGVFYGIQSGADGAVFSDILSQNHTTMAEALLGNGFLTYGAVKNQHVQSPMGFAQGFLEFDGRPGRLGRAFASRASSGQRGSFRHVNRDHRIDARFLDWAGSVGRTAPVFAYLHYMDQHGPNLPRPPYDRMFGTYHEDLYTGMQIADFGTYVSEVRRGRRKLTAAEVAQLEAYYDGQLRDVDRQIGTLLEELRELDLYESSMIILTADHGDAFMEHGFIQHSYTPYDELVLIPLIVKMPGSEVRGSVEHQVRLIDVLPTVLEFAGASAPAELDGASLLGFIDAVRRNESPEEVPFETYAISEHLDDPDAYPTIAIRTENYKYLHFEKKPDELYDLEADPLEQHSIVEARPAEAERFRQMALEIVARRDGPAAGGVQLDEQTIEELKALGYIAE